MSHVDFDTSFSINNVPVCDLWSGKSKSVHWMSIAHQHAHRHRLTGWYRLHSFCTSLGQRVVDNWAGKTTPTCLSEGGEPEMVRGSKATKVKVRVLTNIRRESMSRRCLSRRYRKSTEVSLPCRDLSCQTVESKVTKGDSGKRLTSGKTSF